MRTMQKLIGMFNKIYSYTYKLFMKGIHPVLLVLDKRLTIYEHFCYFILFQKTWILFLLYDDLKSHTEI